jgi:glycerol transport system permease protein
MGGGNERTEQAVAAGQAAALPSELSRGALARRMHRRGEESRWWWVIPTLYIVFLLVAIYWLVNMSF